MAVNWRTGGLFAAGIALGTVVGGYAMLQARKEAVWQMPASPTQTLGNAPARAAPPAAATSSAAKPAVAVQHCDSTAIVARGKEDGRESLQPTPSGATASEVASLILTGKEAAASGRQHDAEISFLNACRNAEVVQATDPVPIADSLYQLARHYTMVAQSGAGDRKQMLQRAERDYAAALQTYRVRYGEQGEKTRFAEQGLASLQKVMASSGTPSAPVVAAAPAAPLKPAPAPAVAQRKPETKAPAPVVASAPPARPAAPPAPAVVVAPPPVAATRPPAPVVAAPAPAPAPEAVARHTSPSFDCKRARSTAEKLICGDEELARMDRDLGRTYARAKQASGDPRAFQRASDSEWQRREACSDKECLRGWYAQRRQQLQAQAAAPAQHQGAAAAASPERAAAPERQEPAAPVARATPRPAREPAPVRRAARDTVEEPAAGPNGVPTASGSATGDAGDAVR